MIEEFGVRIEFCTLMGEIISTVLLSCEENENSFTIPSNAKMLDICFGLEDDFCSDKCFRNETLIKRKNIAVNVIFTDDFQNEFNTHHSEKCDVISIPRYATKLFILFNR